ncbi:hypothetical protein ACFL1E_05700 [Candidatus Omnitrophota bacterium]
MSITCWPTQLALAAEHHWEFAGWYGGGAFPNVTFDPNVENRVYLVSDVAGIWKSDDLGENWISINKGLSNLIVSCLTVSPSDSNILYAGTAAGLFRTKNQGASWEPCNTLSGNIAFSRPDNYKSIAVDRHNPAKVIIGTNRGNVYYSGDYGTRWNQLRLPGSLLRKRQSVSALQLDVKGKGVYVAIGKVLYYSSITRRSYKVLFHAPEIIADFFITNEENPVIFLASGQQIIFSKDSGITWKASAKISRGVIDRVVLFKAGKKETIAIVWHKNWRGGILFSNDMCSTWEDRGEHFVFDDDLNPTRLWANGKERLLSLKVNPFNSAVLFTTGFWGIFKSDDAGFNWQEKIRGADNVSGSDIHINALGEIYVATMDNGLLKSSDGGKSYLPLFPRGQYDKKIHGHVWRVVSHPNNPSHIIGTSSPWDTNLNQIIISQNKGKSFRITSEGLSRSRPRINTMWEEGYARAIALDSSNPHLVYLGIDGDDGGGLFISQDSGWHWKRSQGQPGSKRIYNALAVDPTNSDRLAWGAYGRRGGVYISEDRGKTWKYVFKKMKKVFDLAITSQGWIYAAGDLKGPAIFISKDSGKHWQLLKKFSGLQAAEALLIVPGDPLKMSASVVRWHGGADGKIYWTNDGGESWSDITGDLPPGAGAAAMAYDSKNSYIYIIRYAGSVYRTKL